MDEAIICELVKTVQKISDALMDHELRLQTLKSQSDFAREYKKLAKSTLNPLADHERRLQILERPLDLTTELKHLRNRVEGIEDEEKRKAALFCLASLCEALGIKDVES